MAGLRREILKWLQSLDLTFQVRNPKWDITNGYIIAEIFSWYYPQEVEMHMYYNGTSLETKTKNWALLRNFIKRYKIDISNDLIDGTIHCKEGASVLLIENIYEILTNKRVQKLTLDQNKEFSDQAYQQKLPMHARSTAIKAIKNNVKETEIMAQPDIVIGQFKTQIIIDHHLDHRQQERLQDPERFGIRPTLGELARRRTPSPENSDTSKVSQHEKRSTSTGIAEINNAMELHEPRDFVPKEINVQQPHRLTSLQMAS